MTHHHPKHPEHWTNKEFPRRKHLLTERQFSVGLLLAILALIVICGLVIKANRHQPISRPQPRIIAVDPIQLPPPISTPAEMPAPVEPHLESRGSPHINLSVSNDGNRFVLRGSIDLPGEQASASQENSGQEIATKPSDVKDVAGDSGREEITHAATDDGTGDHIVVAPGDRTVRLHHRPHRLAPVADPYAPVDFPDWMKLPPFN